VHRFLQLPQLREDSLALVRHVLVILERHHDLCAVGHYLVVFDAEVHLDDFAHAYVLQRLRRGFERRSGGCFPGFCARTDQLDDLVDTLHPAPPIDRPDRSNNHERLFIHNTSPFVPPVQLE